MLGNGVCWLSAPGGFLCPQVHLPREAPWLREEGKVRPKTKGMKFRLRLSNLTYHTVPKHDNCGNPGFSEKEKSLLS